MAEANIIDTLAEKNDQIRSADEKQYLTFQLGAEELGIHILNIKEIISYSPVTHIPLVPDYLLGVMNVRGNVVPVVDLGPRFGRPEKSEITKLTCIIILDIKDQSESFEVGIVVDSVEDVIDITSENMEVTPSFGAKIRTDFIGGIGKIGNRFIKLLNIEKVLNLEELSTFDMNMDKLYQEYLVEVKRRDQLAKKSDEKTEKKSENSMVVDSKTVDENGNSEGQTEKTELPKDAEFSGVAQE